MTEHTALALWKTIGDILVGYLLAESLLYSALFLKVWRNKFFCRGLSVFLVLVQSSDYRKEVFWGRTEVYVAVFVLGAAATAILRKFFPLAYEIWLAGCGAFSVLALILLFVYPFVRRLEGVVLYFLEDGVVRSVWIGVEGFSLKDPALQKFVESHVPRGDHVVVLLLRDGWERKLVFFALKGARLSEALAEVFSIKGIFLRDLENLAKAKENQNNNKQEVGYVLEDSSRKVG